MCRHVSHVECSHPVMDIQVVSMAQLLWITLPWIQGCKYLLVVLLSVLLDILPEVEFLDQMIVLFLFYLIFLRNSILFSIAVAPFYIPTNSAPGFSTPPSTLVIFKIGLVLFVAAILMQVRWYLMVVFCLFVLLLVSYSCPAFLPIALPYPIHHPHSHL